MTKSLLRRILLACVLLAGIVILAGCSTKEPAPLSAVPRTSAPGHGHIAEEHSEVLSGAGNIGALVLIRRLDGLNQHEGGPGVVGERFGIVAVADDMDGDGVLDLIIGSPRADPGGTAGTNEGSVHVFSGAALLRGAELKHALLYQVRGEATTNGTGELGFRQSIATADLDRDSFPELVVGAWLADPIAGGVPKVDAGTVFVFNGAALLRGERQEMALMFRLDGEPGSRLGRPAIVVGDIDLDGVPDLFVGAHRASPLGVKNAGSGYLISGADFSILHRFDGVSPYDFLGRSVMSVGDLNSDGYLDLAIGASQGDGGQAGEIPSGPGYVNVYSGKDYSLLRHLNPPLDEPTGAFGQTTVYVPTPVAGADLNEDGIPEVIVGSPEARAGLQGPPGKDGFPRTGSVYIYSGADFSPLYRLKGERGSVQAEAGLPTHETPRAGNPGGNIGDVFGDAIAVVPDMDGDGVPDLVVGAPRGDGQDPDGSYPLTLTDSGYVKIFSGTRGTPLARLNGPGESTNMGHHVVGVGDVNNDGRPDILIGADLTNYGGKNAGSLYWYSIALTKLAE
ncbi:MAG: FG-GAP repeat protein [Chloroflexi bacterium]|nr:FG-GAP repeat protein [Chloroflexota bacterium]